MKSLKRFLILLSAAFAVVYIWSVIYSVETPLVNRSIAADTNRIKKDLQYLTKECQYRNFLHPAQLQKAAEYIRQEFLTISAAVDLQHYSVEEEPFMNVICSLGPRDAERIIVGAHYDACLDQEGADDNASGIAGLLELGRLLKKKNLRYRVDLVAYSNEEPPFLEPIIWAVTSMQNLCLIKKSP